MRSVRLHVALAASIGLALSCSFGLDPSLIEHGDELPDRTRDPNADGGPNGIDGSVQPMGTKCTADGECRTTHGCLTGRCDVVRGVCVYDVCKQPAPSCAVATCDEGSGVCGAPSAPHPFHAGTFDVGAAVPCIDNAISKCIAAAHPFVFVLTTSGVRAYSAIDPTSATPKTIALSGPSFTPDQILATSSRVYFIGPVVGGTTAQIAWADIPVDPFAKTIAVTSQATLAMPSDAGTSALPTTTDSVYVIGALAPFATGHVGTTTGATVPSYPLPALPQYSSVSAATGTRLLVAAAFGGTDFRIVTNPGTPTPSMTPDGGTPATQGMLALVYGQGADGSVFLHGGVFGGAYPNLGYTQTGVVWLVANAASTDYGTQRVTVETYAPVAQTYPLGPVVWIDANRVLVAADAAVGGPNATSVQIATKATNPPSLVPNRRFVVQAPVGRVGASSSNGRAYVLVSEASAKVHVFAPDCN